MYINGVQRKSLPYTLRSEPYLRMCVTNHIGLEVNNEYLYLGFYNLRSKTLRSETLDCKTQGTDTRYASILTEDMISLDC